MKACLKGVSKRRRSGLGMEKCCTVDNLDFSALNLFAYFDNRFWVYMYAYDMIKVSVDRLLIVVASVQPLQINGFIQDLDQTEPFAHPTYKLVSAFTGPTLAPPRWAEVDIRLGI